MAQARAKNEQAPQETVAEHQRNGKRWSIMSFNRRRLASPAHRNPQLPLTRRNSVHVKKERERPAGEAPSRSNAKHCLLNNKLEKEICDYLRAGASLDDSAVMVGIGRKTLSDWRHKGCEDVDSRFGLFFERTEHARTEWKTRAIKRITDSADWKASWKCSVRGSRTSSEIS